MARWSRLGDPDGPVVPPEAGPLGVPADPTGKGPGQGLQAAVLWWRAQRRLRRAELRETKVVARENLRDFKQSTGSEVARQGASAKPARHALRPNRVHFRHGTGVIHS